MGALAVSKANEQQTGWVYKNLCRTMAVSEGKLKITVDIPSHSYPRPIWWRFPSCIRNLSTNSWPSQTTPHHHLYLLLNASSRIWHNQPETHSKWAQYSHEMGSQPHTMPSSKLPTSIGNNGVHSTSVILRVFPIESAQTSGVINPVELASQFWNPRNNLNQSDQIAPYLHKNYLKCRRQIKSCNFTWFEPTICQPSTQTNCCSCIEVGVDAVVWRHCMGSVWLEIAVQVGSWIK